jgi:hypothetical protein
MNEEYVGGSTTMETFQIEDAPTYDADNRQLVLRADFEDDESDDDYEPSEDDKDEDEDMDEDVLDEDLQLELSNEDDDGFSSEDPLLDDLPHEKMRMAAQELREAFPKAPMSVCKNVLLRFDGDLGKAWESLTHGFKPSKPRTVIEAKLRDRGVTPVAKASKTRRTAKSERIILEENNEGDPLDEGDEAFPNDYNDSLLEYYDQHGLPGGSISTGNVLTQMAEIVANMDASNSKLDKSSPLASRIERLGIVTSSNKSARLVVDHRSTKELEETAVDEDDDSSDLDTDSSSADSDDSSSESSDDSGDSDDADSTSSSGSSDSSDSSSGSDSEPEEVSSKFVDISTKRTTPSKSKEASKNESLPEVLSTKPQPTVPPGEGKRSTKKRNQRRRNANALRRFQEKGILPAGTTINEFEQLDMDQINTPRDASEALSAIRTENAKTTNKEKPKTAPKDAEFEARRQKLLAAIASGGVQVGPELSSNASNHDSDNVTEALDVEMTNAAPTTEDAQFNTPSRLLASANDTGAKIDVTNSPQLNVSTAFTVQIPRKTVESATDSAPQSRKKLDMGAAGRLVFGALGVRTPKTKADEEKVRNDLMKHVQPTKSASTAKQIADAVDPESEGDDPNAWKKVINLRAVECCHDGIELSPAPFPFVQRWDPQQQGNHWQPGGRGGKGKKNQRNQAHFYEHEQHVSKKRKRNRTDSRGDYDRYSETQPVTNEVNDYQENEVEFEHGKALGTDGLYSDGVEGEINEQLMRDVQEAAATSQSFNDDDLPRLPKDISTLSNLSAEQVNTGMVIAFKQLILSEATNWQPQMSNYLTAVIIKVLEYGAIELTLAKRDRDMPEKHYDELTGERIYGKFDMPDDEEEEEDDGFRSLTFTELIEPKIVQDAPENLISPKASVATSVEVSHEKTNASNDESTTLGHEDSADKPKASIEDVRQIDGSIDKEENPATKDNLPSFQQPAGEELSADDTEEILKIIKEAGFRSNVPSSITRPRPQPPTIPVKESQNRSYSPRFNGFGSSPPPQIISSPSYGKTGEPTPSPIAVIQDHSNIADVHYPKLSVPSSLASQVTDHGRQPDFPSPGEDTLHEFDGHDSFLGIQDDQPVVEPGLPSAKPPSVSDEPRFKVPSIPSSEVDPPSPGGFPTLDEVFSNARSSVVPKQEVPKAWELATDLSREAKVEEEYNKAMEELDASLDAVDGPDQVTPKASQSYTRKELKTQSSPPQTKTRTTKSQPTRSRTTKSQFVIPPGSQQVDLTLSNDVEVAAEKETDFDELYDESFGLPTGPGWVDKKKRKTRQSTSSIRSASQPTSSKSRLTRRKTTTRF